jgi:ribosomal protein L40E
MANAALIGFGLLFLIGSVIAYFAFTAQEKSQIELSGNVCDSVFGKVGSSASSDIADECEKAKLYRTIIQITPIGFIIGLAMLIAGAAVGGGKEKEVIIHREPQPIHHTIISPQPHTRVIERVVVKCPNCGAKNDEDSEYCKKCAESLTSRPKKEEEKPKKKQEYCKQCGAKLKDNDKFCRKCGETIKQK